MLIDFDQGKLSAHDVDVISGHLDVCERCEGFLHVLQRQSTSDGLIALLKRCMQGPPIPDEFLGAAYKATSETFGVNSADPIGRVRPFAHEPAPPLQAIARTVGQYALHERIGQGGMGVVYRAQQVPLKRMVALKMISGGHHAASQTVARFIREGKAIARLRHPNVVQIYDLGESEGLPYYAMELVEGGNLQAKLAGGPFEPRAAAELVRTLAEAVEFAHQVGVVHRDLKPANILLTGTGAPKITDFGLAKMLDADSEGLTTAPFTASNMILGTPSYMAPEQAEGRADEIGRATDVYALGAILYALLIGRPPFAGGSKVKILEF
ncbi:MAG: eukaryotic-like serine/threonine-protein kinase, partial [Chloroflexota bacterium]|nr:eukaryotic-like serine/threonine-protein kinase [Chloroflexota bacterium]